jgi:HlyD family type I secretion membrane fusion protein
MQAAARSTDTDEAQPPPWASGIRTSLVVPVLLTLVFAGGGLGGFLAWAATAPIAGSVMATGHVAANGDNQTIQHLEGGIVHRIHVREGGTVEAGEPLITLDSTLVQANLNRAHNLLSTLRIDAAVLSAEMLDQDDVVLTDDIDRATLSPQLAEFLGAKTTEYSMRKQRFRNEISIIAQRLAGVDEEITGLKAQREAILKQIPLIQQELKDLDYLFNKGLARKERLLALQRSEADLQGRAEALVASTGKARQLSAELLQQMEKLWHDRRTEASTRLAEVRNRIADTMEQIVSYENILSRIVIASPTAGTVVRLKVNTLGAVISPGQAVAELLPRGTDLVVEGKLQLADVDAVQVGGAANVRLSALNQRTTPVLDSKVLYISPDRLTDQATQEQYYRVKLTLDPQQLPPSHRKLLMPGMPAEAFIKTSERTMLRYLFRPIEDSMAKAMREE